MKKEETAVQRAVAKAEAYWKRGKLLAWESALKSVVERVESATLTDASKVDEHFRIVLDTSNDAKAAASKKKAVTLEGAQRALRSYREEIAMLDADPPSPDQLVVARIVRLHKLKRRQEAINVKYQASRRCGQSMAAVLDSRFAGVRKESAAELALLRSEMSSAADEALRSWSPPPADGRGNLLVGPLPNCLGKYVFVDGSEAGQEALEELLDSFGELRRSRDELYYVVDDIANAATYVGTTLRERMRARLEWAANGPSHFGEKRDLTLFGLDRTADPASSPLALLLRHPEGSFAIASIIYNASPVLDRIASELTRLSAAAKDVAAVVPGRRLRREKAAQPRTFKSNVLRIPAPRALLSRFLRAICEGKVVYQAVYGKVWKGGNGSYGFGHPGGHDAGGNEAAGDEAGGDEADGDEADGDETDGDETDGDETDGDETDGEETVRDEAGGGAGSGAVNAANSDMHDEDESGGGQGDSGATGSRDDRERSGKKRRLG
jgi:hypothetical protein